jgi:hypothetical protein
MKFTFESSMWIDVKIDEDGDFILTTLTSDGDRVEIYTHHKNHIAELKKNMSLLKLNEMKR